MQVNLAEELTLLKVLIRAQCERVIATGIDPDAIDIMEEGGLQDQSIASSPPTVSRSQRICLLNINPQSPSDQPSSMNVQCTLANHTTL